MKKQILKRLNKQGFTLVELLVAMGISGVVMAGIYTVYYSQQKSYAAQEQMAAMQQNLRAAIYFMEREIRMAGYDPRRDAAADIQTAGFNTINFTLDITNTAGTGNPDGLLDGPNEDITYDLDDNDGDGYNDLERNGSLIAENIDALDFVYLDGASPPNVLDDDGNGNVVASIPLIRSIQITIVARVDRANPGYTDTNAYFNQADLEILPAQNDGFRRKRLTTEVKCRNLGL